MANITYLPKIWETSNVVIRSLEEIANIIKSNPGIKLDTQEIHNWASSNNYVKGMNKQKDAEFKKMKEKLPAFIASGEFNYADNNGLDIYYGLIIIDIDKIPNPYELQQRIINDETVVMCFTSISRQGLKVVHKLDYRGFNNLYEHFVYHRQAWEHLSKKYKETFNIDVDPDGQDISRKCFISYDPNVYFNPKAKKFGFEYKYEDPKPSENPESEFYNYYQPYTINEGDAETILDSIVDWATKFKISLLDEYKDYIDGGLAIRSVISDKDKGFKYYNDICKLSPKYDEKNIESKWENIYTSYDSNRGKKVTLGSLIWLAQKKGFEVKKNKMDNASLRNFLIQILTEKEIWLKFNSLRNTLLKYNKEHKIWETISIRWLNELYIIIFNSIVGKEYAYDFLMAIAKEFNPIHDFINSIKEWDGVDYLSQLYDTIQVKEEDDRNVMKMFIRKWLIGVIEAAQNGPSKKRYNENVLILIGGQGIGKTRWTRSLLPIEYQDLYTEKNINLRDKDDEKIANESLIIFMDEFGNIINDRTSIEDFKNFVSQTKITMRVPYGRSNEDFYKYASFVGSSNPSQILTDTTGNRRFWPIEIESINYMHDINVNGLWSQIYSYWKAGEAHWLTKEEQSHLSLYNERFEREDSIIELINLFFDKGEEHMTATTMILYINEQFGKDVIKLNYTGAFGRLCNKYGFKRIRSKDKKWGYYVSKKVVDQQLIMAKALKFN